MEKENEAAGSGRLSVHKVVKRIAIVGPESTGKTELSRRLAMALKTEWVPEYARFYLDRLERDYEEHDLLAIAKGQLAWENEKEAYASRLLICDTNLLVIKVWSDFKYGRTSPWIAHRLSHRPYAGYLLANHDLPWKPDPRRENPNDREHLFGMYRDYLISNKLPFTVVSGIKDDRLQSALNGLGLLGIDI